MMDNNTLVLDLVDESSTERELVWLHTNLKQIRPNANDSIPITRAEYIDEITFFLDNRHFTDIYERNAYIRKVKNECSSSLLPTHEFKWIDKSNERLIHWLWFYLLFNHKLKGSINSSNLVVKHREIISFFDVMREPTHSKLALLHFLKRGWNELIHKRLHDYNWLKKNDQSQCIWAHRYIEKHIKQGVESISVVSRDLCSDTYSFVMVNIDLWPVSQEKQHKLATKMKLAWRQKLVRQKAKEKAAKMSLKVSQRHLLMLAEVADIYEHDNKNKTLELMIEKEYNKLRHSWLKPSSF